VKTAIEAKLAQQLTWMEHEPLYQVFVELRIEHNRPDIKQCLEIMTGYGVGPRLLRLHPKFWNQANMVCHAGGSFGKQFEAFLGNTQGGTLFRLMFNVCVDAVIREHGSLRLSGLGSRRGSLLSFERFNRLVW